MKFPSPCGEKVGINDLGEAPSSIAVPRFPSPCGEKVGINIVLVSDWLDRGKFPSPCGEKVGINPTPGKG